MSYIILRGLWCHTIVLNVYAPTKDKNVHMKDTSYEELQCLLNTFPKYHMKILLGDLSIRLAGENIFELTIWNESLHGISNENGVRPHIRISQPKVLCSHRTIFWMAPHEKDSQSD
jgi:hypothetical protein